MTVVMDNRPFPELRRIIREANDSRIWSHAEWVSARFALAPPAGPARRGGVGARGGRGGGAGKLLGRWRRAGEWARTSHSVLTVVFVLRSVLGL